MIQLVWLIIGFQIFIAFTLSYKLHSVFKNSSKMIQEQAAAAVIIALISEKNKSREKGEKKKNLYETLA